MSKGHKAAGGIKSRNVSHRSAPKAEPKAHAKVVAGVAQIGQRQGNHVTERGATRYGGVRVDAGRGYEPKGPTNLLVNGPKGQGRTVYRTGTQGRQFEPHSESAEAKRYTGTRAMRNEDAYDNAEYGLGRRK